MRIRTKGDGIKAAKAAIASYEEQRSDLQAELSRVEADRNKVQKQLEGAVEDLATGLLRSAEAAAVDAAASETGAMHLASVLDKLHDELEAAKVRVQEILGMSDYIRREELTHPTTGEYSVKIEEFANLVGDVERTLAPFKMKEFQWLYKRGVHEPQDPSVFGKFWRVVTLADRRESSATEKVLRRLKYETFTQCADIYDDQRKVLRGAKKDLAEWEGKRDGVLALVTEHDELVHWVANFDNEAVEALRSELAEHLTGCDYTEIHRGVRPAGKVLAAKAEALTQKLEYLQNVADYLRKEIHDRDNRISSIDRVQLKWRRKPYGLLRGDKTKWLVQVPAMKRESTNKRVRWCGTMRDNVTHYDDYDIYSGFMAAGVVFLAYDAFNFGADERPPYEGFTRDVIPSLDEFRVEHDMERADYSGFRGVEGEDYGGYAEDWDQSVTDIEQAEAAAAEAEAAEAEASAALAESEGESGFSDDS